MNPPTEDQRKAYLNTQAKKIKKKPKKGKAGVNEAAKDQKRAVSKFPK